MRDTPVSKRHEILEAAFGLFSQNPGASMSDLAASAGVGRATLHRYFPQRQDLMVALTLAAEAELEAAVDAATAGCETHTDGLRVAFLAMLPLASRYMFLASDPAQNDAKVAEVYDAQTAALVQEIEGARTEGTFAPEVPTAWIVAAYENLLFAGWEMVSRGEATPKQAATLAWRTLTHGLTPQEDK